MSRARCGRSCAGAGTCHNGTRNRTRNCRGDAAALPMSLSDFMKKLFSSGDTLLSMEPQCVRYEWFTMRLPSGWQFTRADNRGFALSGPDASSAEIVFVFVRGVKAADLDKHRSAVLEIMRRCLGGETAQEQNRRPGLLWMEAGDAANAQLRIALLNARPRDPEALLPPVLDVTLATPAAGPAVNPAAGAAAQFRDVLLDVQWN